MTVIRKSLGLATVLALLLLGVQGLDRLEREVETGQRQQSLIEAVEQAPDVYAWLTVEGTRIDYPLVQHATDDTYYLSHDVTGQVTEYGAIFTELVNSKTFDDPVTIIYGHAMRDGAMFGTLDEFADPEFFTNHGVITIDRQDKSYVYEVISAHPYTDDHLFETFQLGSQEGKITYLETLKERTLAFGGNYRQWSQGDKEDRVLILSTCDVASDDQRYVVTAILKTVSERSS